MNYEDFIVTNTNLAEETSGFYGVPSADYYGTVRDYNGVHFLMTPRGNVTTGWIQQEKYTPHYYHFNSGNDNANVYSNFQFFGIGKPSAKQIARREKAKKALEDAKKNIKQTTQDILKNKNLKKVLKANFLTYNPAVAIPRSSALLAFRVNLFGISSRLYPAFLDDASLSKYNFNIENAKNAKKAWEKVANFWEDKIGGDRNKLREAISGAWNKPIFKTKKSQARKGSTSTFDGDTESYSNYTDGGASAIAGYISAGLSVVGGIVKIISDNGAKKNPYNVGTPEYNDFQNQMSGVTDPSANQNELNAIYKANEGDKAKGLPLDNTGIDLSDASDDDKIMGIPKTGFYVGLTVLALVGGYLIYKNFIAKK